MSEDIADRLHDEAEAHRTSAGLKIPPSQYARADLLDEAAIYIEHLQSLLHTALAAHRAQSGTVFAKDRGATKRDPHDRR